MMSSRDIAALFEKSHDNVLKDVRKLQEEASKSLETLNAVKIYGVEYTDKKGETRTCYHLNRIAAYTLVQGYNGPKAFPLRVAMAVANGSISC